jgi:hypothetical protein
MRVVAQDQYVKAMKRAVGVTQLTTDDALVFASMAADATARVADSAMWRDLLTQFVASVSVGQSWVALPADFKPEPNGSVVVSFVSSATGATRRLPIVLRRYGGVPSALPTVATTEIPAAVAHVEVVSFVDPATGNPVAWYLHFLGGRVGSDLHHVRDYVYPAVQSVEAGAVTVNYYRTFIASLPWLMPAALSEACEAEAVHAIMKDRDHANSEARAVDAKRAMDRALAVLAVDRIGEHVTLDPGHFPTGQGVTEPGTGQMWGMVG